MVSVSALAVAASLLIPQQPAGLLVILGGGRESDTAAKLIAEHCGGSKLVVLAHSRENPAQSAAALKEFFEKAGAKNVDAPTSEKPEDILASLKDAKGVFMSGGDQNRFIARFPESSKVPEAIRAVYTNGGVVAGTSAGASLIGEWMPTGNGNETVKGLGVLPGIIFDQHFFKRNRQDRLRAMVGQRKVMGLGIEERAFITFQKGMVIAFEGPTLWIVPKEGADAEEKTLQTGDSARIFTQVLGLQKTRSSRYRPS